MRDKKTTLIPITLHHIQRQLQTPSTCPLQYRCFLISKPLCAECGRRRSKGTAQTRRRLEFSEDDIIKIPGCDLVAVIERFKRTIIGRMFYRDGRSMEALLTQLPSARIWDMEGRVKGTNLSNGRFQFDIDKEEDLVKVLANRLCHFNRWSFALEGWEPSTQKDFPFTMPFLMRVTGVPAIGKALGHVLKTDAEKAHLQVFINVNEPLQFERRVGFLNGNVGKIEFKYEGLQRFCFKCKRISHETSSCPEVPAEEKQSYNKLGEDPKGKRDSMLFQKDAKDSLMRMKSPVWEEYENQYQQSQSRNGFRETGENFSPERRRSDSHPSKLGKLNSGAIREVWQWSKERDLWMNLRGKRLAQNKDVWNRINEPYVSYFPRLR
ncbi:unnamed protein product [Thlaspi arvense]|uniref:DUF4283 domain-containing protein n=1 Tax=Thlaspi arvense TaxID=13288 RepID=A0AAU9T6J0_THLAR|nr:unnamed protein product [Thlaspi arvense]